VSEPDSPSYTGSRLVLDVLIDEGIDTVFGVPGGAIMPLYDAMYTHPIRHILTRHEQGAAFGAGGYARATGRVGVCMATSGPGATNLLTGILDAQMDSVPLLAITGQVRTPLMGTDAFQEADISSMAQGATKRAICVHSLDDLERTLRAALRLARGPRPGAVLVDIPQDLLKAPCSPPRQSAKTHVVRSDSDRRKPDPEHRADDAALDEAVELLRNAKRPVAVVGGGARSADATALYRAFCAKLQLPHTATINGLGCAQPGDARFLGMLGMHGWKAANLAISQADVIIALGMRFDDRVTGRTDRFAPDATIIHADVDPCELNKIIPAAVSLRGDLRDTLARLNQRLETAAAPTFEAWAQEAQALGTPPPRDRTPNVELSATDVLDAFFEHAPAGTIVTTDVGQHQMWAAQRMRATNPRNFITSAGLGTMGFGMPAAIGAQLGRPESIVVAISGDGGFQMTLPELATIKRYDLPVKILLIDNQRLGMVRQWQELFYERRYAHTDLSDNPDFVAIAKAYGLHAEFTGPGEDLDAALDRFLNEKGPALLHCACFPTENVWPLIPPGGAISEGMEPITA
jgi:acetolactate synthase-1/2/3 large subunit